MPTDSSRSPVRFGALSAPVNSRPARRAFLAAAVAVVGGLVFGAAVARADGGTDVNHDAIDRGGTTVVVDQARPFTDAVGELPGEGRSDRVILTWTSKGFVVGAAVASSPAPGLAAWGDEAVSS